MLLVRRAFRASEETTGASCWERATVSEAAFSMTATTGSVGVSSAGVPSPELSPSLEAEAVRLTMTVTEEETVPLETMTEVAPVLTPVMTPLPLTVAILVSLDLKVRLWEAVEGATLPVMVLLEPGLSTT